MSYLIEDGDIIVGDLLEVQHPEHNIKNSKPILTSGCLFIVLPFLDDSDDLVQLYCLTENKRLYIGNHYCLINMKRLARCE